jgi:hypothetical protein
MLTNRKTNGAKDSAEIDSQMLQKLHWNWPKKTADG